MKYDALFHAFERQIIALGQMMHYTSSIWLGSVITTIGLFFWNGIVVGQATIYRDTQPLLAEKLGEASIVLEAGRIDTQELQRAIPSIYDDAETATWHVPLADAKVSPSFLTSSYFYARKTRLIYKSYPLYHPDQEPDDYINELKRTRPIVLWGDEDSGDKPKLETTKDWIQAGLLVYDNPIFFRPLEDVSYFRNPSWLNDMRVPVAKDGTIPGIYYTVRERGNIEIGIFSCATCHTRVIEDRSFAHGAQGNLPLARIEAWEIRNGKAGRDEEVRQAEFEYHGTPWISGNENAGLLSMSKEDIAAARAAIPPGVYPNHNGSIFSPVHTADFIRLVARPHFDFTGHMRHRNVADLMRFIDFHQWASRYASFGQYRPQPIPDPEQEERYSDEQAFALALYAYLLEPPKNVNSMDALANQGRAVFEREGCAECHVPERGYTNHKLTIVDGFTVPVSHPEREHVMPQSVHTDSRYALETRKGTGFYKVPSLLGVSRRGPFEHNGSCATLEDWFDGRRLADDYVPTGWKGVPGTSARAVRGHEFGLDVTKDDKKALIAFLRTL